MKNLKKILTTLVLVALVVSAAVTFVIAEGAYAGTVSDAKVLLDNAIAAKPGAGSTAEDAKVEPLKALYTYLLTVDPNDDGYNEIKDHYNQMTFKVAYSLYKKVANCSTLTDRSKALAAAYDYVAAAPAICNSTDAVALHHGFKCVNDGCGKYRDFTDDEYLNGITDALRCPGTCSKQDQKLVYASDEEELYTYSDFELEINKESVDIASSLMAALYGMAESETSGTADYYDVLAAAKIFVDYIGNPIEKIETVSPSEIYTGDVTVAAQLIKGLGTSSSFDELKASLAEAYEYLVENPVMPTSAAYLTFIEKYNELGDVMIVKFVETLAECKSISDKINAFSSFYEYLADTQLSEKVVKAYNELRDEFVGNISEVESLVEEITKIEASVPTIEYRNDFDAFVAELAAAETAYEAGEDITVNIANLYAFVSSIGCAGNFDPATEGYGDAVAKYVDLCTKYVNDVYVDAIAKAETMSSKYNSLINFYNFVFETPLCEAVTDIYAKVYADFFGTADALVKAIASIKELPTYTKPETVAPTAVVTVLNDMLAKIQTTCDKYDAAEADAKAALLEEMKAALEKLYRYILGNGIDVEANSEFVQFYSNARSRVVDAMLGVVAAAENADAKLAALKSAKEYLESVHVAYSEIVKYNKLALATAGEEFYIVSVYEEIYSCTAEILEGKSFEKSLELGKALAKYGKMIFDVTDPEYANYLVASNAAFKKLGNDIKDNLPIILTGAGANEYAGTINEFVKYATDTNDEYVVNAVCDSINTLSADVSNMLNGAANYQLQSLADAFLELGKEFDKAKKFEDRLSINAIFFRFFSANAYDTTELKLSASYELIAAEAKRVADAVEAELMAIIKAEGSPDTVVHNLNSVYGYISENPFSQTLIAKYNEVYETIVSTDFGAYADSVTESVVAAEYVTPENFSKYVARINLALDLYDQTGEFKYFSVAYVILCAIQGVDADGPKAVDFGIENFASVIGRFALAKDALVKANVELFESASDLTEMGAAVAAIKEMVETVPYLADIQQSYTDICSRLNVQYKSLIDTTLANFTVIANQIADHLEICPVNTSVLSDNVYSSRYNTIKSFVKIVHFTSVEQMITSYASFSGETKLAYQKMLVDKIEKYIAVNGLETFSDSMLVSNTVKFAFEEFINKFDKELESADLATKARDIKAIGEYLVMNNFPNELIDLYNAKFGLALTYNAAAAAEANGSLAEFGVLVNEMDFAKDANAIFFALENLVKYVNTHKFDTTDKSNTLKSDLADISKQITADTEAQIAELENKVSNVEYAYPVFAKFNHEDSALYAKTMNTSKGTVSIVGDADNKYAQMSVTAKNDCYLDINTAEGGMGVVADFDLMAPNSLDYVLYLVTSKGTISVVDFADGVLQYNYEGLEYSGYQQGVSEQIAIAPEQWVHITVVANYKDATVELFVNYASLGIMDLDKLDNVTAVRMQPKYSEATTLTCYDNLYVYSGTMYRNLDNAETIGYDELFKAYVEAIYNEQFTVGARMDLYYTAATFKNSASIAVNDYKVLFDSFDTAPLVEVLCDKYLTELEDKAKSLVDLSAITSKNIATHVKTVTTVETFINANRQYMVGERFKAVSELLVAVKEKQVWFNNLTSATTHLARFQRATSLSSLTRHYELYAEYYALCELDDEANMLAAENDPIVTTFITSMKAESDVVAYLSTVTFEAYCHEYIPYRLAKQTYKENSSKIIDAIGFIKKLAGDEKTFENSDAYYEVLAQKARENYDYAESYLGVVRGIVLQDAYDGSIDGVIEAITLANKLDGELAEIRKEKQLAVIKEKIDEYALTTSYIEKAGICTFLDNYIAEYNIDMSTQDAIQYYYALQIYKAELESYMVDYEEVLEANTQAFIGLVAKMQSYVTYAELKPLYEEAISKYYYSMNIDSPEAAAAVEIFEQYKNMILDWESNSTLFIAYVKELNASARQAQQFRALVKCANYLDKIDTGIAGVSEALAKYNNVLASYSEMINPAMSDMAEMSSVVCSLRVNSMPAAVLAVLNRMMGN